VISVKNSYSEVSSFHFSQWSNACPVSAFGYAFIYNWEPSVKYSPLLVGKYILHFYFHRQGYLTNTFATYITIRFEPYKPMGPQVIGKVPEEQGSNYINAFAKASSHSFRELMASTFSLIYSLIQHSVVETTNLSIALNVS
jgi:hypothetical protein